MKNYARIQNGRLKNCLESKTINTHDGLEKNQLCLEMISYFERKGESYGVPMLDLLIHNTEARKKCHQTKVASAFNKQVTFNLLKDNCQFDVKNAIGIVEVSEIYRKDQAKR